MDPSAMRRLSRRRDGEDPIRDIAILQRTLNRLRGPKLVPRGLYRFASHLEAHEWMMNKMAQCTCAPRPTPMSPPSSS